MHTNNSEPKLKKNTNNKKFIFVTGGVISGVGKGVATASIALILKKYGFKVNTIKIDPYINVDAGTLRPTEHGEVWVTFDGGETDQDIGTYERFLNQELSRQNSITTGQIYKTVIDKERKGEFLGKTVQFVPHIINEIKRRIIQVDDSDITLVELGGTVGDYENIPFLFAAKSIEKDIGRDNVLYVLVTYLPVPSHIGEMKTKPTQQAIKQLSETGIFPDLILARSENKIDKVRREKIEKYGNIPSEYVISAPDVESIYEVPLNFQKDKLGIKMLNKLRLKPKRRINLVKWEKLTTALKTSKSKVEIALVGKYLKTGNYDLKDSYVSVIEALNHAAAHLNARVMIRFVPSEDIEKKGVSLLKGVKGIIVPGGFGSKGIEGKIKAIKYARENNIPYLGLCLGLQLAMVEFARNVLKMKDAHTTEINPKTKHPIVMILPEQRKLLKEHAYGATMRLGEYSAVLNKESRVFSLYKETGRLNEDMKTIRNYKKLGREDYRLGYDIKLRSPTILERHRHRYEVNPEYIKLFEDKGVLFSGFHYINEKDKLVEFIELKNHKFFVATQAHPEFKSRFEDPSPLFKGFLEASMN